MASGPPKPSDPADSFNGGAASHEERPALFGDEAVSDGPASGGAELTASTSADLLAALQAAQHGAASTPTRAPAPSAPPTEPDVNSTFDAPGEAPVDVPVDAPVDAPPEAAAEARAKPSVESADALPIEPPGMPLPSTAASAAVNGARPSRAVSRPPQRRASAADWLTLLMCLAIASPPLLMLLYHPDVTDRAEATALATSIHTWTRLGTDAAIGETFIERLVPHYNGAQQWYDAPGVTWSQLLAFELAAPKPKQHLTITAAVGEDGRLQPMPPFDPVDAAGTTPQQLAEHLAQCARQQHKFTRVDVQAKRLPSDAASKQRTDQRGSDENRPLEAGDRVDLRVEYVEPAWRADVPTKQLVEWGRLGSFVLALLTIAAVYWAGHSIGGRRTALFAALFCAANPVFIWYARLASAPIHQTAWATLSVAAALWAIRPLKPAPSIERQFIGWVVCGLAFGAAALVSGPVVVATVGLPIFVLLLLCPHRRGHLMGLIAALLVGVLLVVPWTALLHNHDPDAAALWWAQHDPFSAEAVEQAMSRIGLHLLLLLAALGPWLVWLVGGVTQPFSTSSVGSRQRLSLGLAWFTTLVVMLWFAPQWNGLGGLLPIVPAASVMLGQLMRHFTELAAEGRYPRMWRLLCWPHLLLLAAASVFVPLLMLWPALLIDQGWLDEPAFINVGWPMVGGLIVVLIGLLFLSLRMVWRRYPARALAFWVAWVVIGASVMAIPWSRGPATRSKVRDDAKLIAHHCQDLPVFSLQADPNHPVKLDPALFLYAGREMPPIAAEQIDQVAAKRQSSIFVISPTDGPSPGKALTPVDTLTSVGLRLWKYQFKADAAR